MNQRMSIADRQKDIQTSSNRFTCLVYCYHIVESKNIFKQNSPMAGDHGAWRIVLAQVIYQCLRALYPIIMDIGG